jgi:cation diffusion facilitator family transporter
MSNQKTQAARLSVISNAVLVVLKLAAGIVAGSASVISEAAHSAVDLVASGVAFFSVRVAEVPADQDHPYGHGKIESISAVGEAILILGAAGFIIYHSILKLQARSPVEHLSLGMVVMAFSAIVNWLISSYLFRIARETESPALEADAHHLRVDVLTSVAVFAGLAAVAITGQVIFDALIAIGVALLISKVAWDLTRESGGHLLDRRLPASEMSRLQDILEADARVLGYHKVRARRAGSQRHIDLHLQFDQDMSLRDAHRLAEEVEDKIRAEFGQVNVITHVEPATEEELAPDEADPGIRKGRTPSDLGSV